MHFKHPEILWALLLLLIPIIVHLFRLRRFKKEAFTNVRFLREIDLQTRKSSTLKKWLVLLMRLSGLAMLVLAFAQPYLGNPDASEQDATYVIYFDNSYSMQMPAAQGSLLESAVNRFLSEWPADIPVKVITNDGEFGPGTKSEIRNQLLALSYTPKQLDLNEVVLKANPEFGLKKRNNALYILSDLQKTTEIQEPLPPGNAEIRLISLKSPDLKNITIDSLSLSDDGPENITINVSLSITGNEAEESTPVSIFSDSELLARGTAAFRSGSARVQFTLPKEDLTLNRVEISDSGLKYDNYLYFSTEEDQKISVMHIGISAPTYLRRIFTDDEFNFVSVSPNAVDFNQLSSQNLVILDQLDQLPEALGKTLVDLAEKGMKIVQIPSFTEVSESFNTLNQSLGLPLRDSIIRTEAVVNTINYDHPLVRDVFNDRIQNFRYPEVSGYFSIRGSTQNVLEFSGNIPFLFGSNGHYAFTAPLDEESSDFQSSALIVPVFYNIGLQSLNRSKAYFTLSADLEADIKTQLKKDQILSLQHESGSFIPRQQNFGNYIRIFLDEQFTAPGHYGVMKDKEKIGNLSLNLPRTESVLEFLDPEVLKEVTFYDSINEGLDQVKIENKVNELWKWFVIFAIVFFLTEMLILKYFK